MAFVNVGQVGPYIIEFECLSKRDVLFQKLEGLESIQESFSAAGERHSTERVELCREQNFAEHRPLHVSWMENVCVVS